MLMGTERDGCFHKTAFLAIDAKPFTDYRSQLTEANLRRELNKLYVGFQRLTPDLCPGVVTGHWGCGEFAGDRRLKALLQVMVAAATGRLPIVHCTMGDSEMSKDLRGVVECIVRHQITVGELWTFLRDFNTYLRSHYERQHRPDHLQLYPFITRACRSAGRQQ